MWQKIDIVRMMTRCKTDTTGSGCTIARLWVTQKIYGFSKRKIRVRILSASLEVISVITLSNRISCRMWRRTTNWIGENTIWFSSSVELKELCNYWQLRHIWSVWRSRDKFVCLSSPPPTHLHWCLALERRLRRFLRANSTPPWKDPWFYHLPSCWPCRSHPPCCSAPPRTPHRWTDSWRPSEIMGHDGQCKSIAKTSVLMV